MIWRGIGNAGLCNLAGSVSKIDGRVLSFDDGLKVSEFA